MSIGKRLFNMARSELNALLDRAAEAERQSHSSRDPDEDLYRRFSLDELTDAELEAEIERRHRARQAAGRSSGRAGAHSSSARPAAGRTGPAGRSSTGGARSSAGAHAKKAAPPDDLRLAYAALEVPYGADFATVRKSYRALMRKYHPDRHTTSPEKQRAATELAQKLSLAYELVEKHARR
jgi:DnaJ-domain-containing protein 1